jgi:hypothetical protein
MLNARRQVAGAVLAVVTTGAGLQASTPATGVTHPADDHMDVLWARLHDTKAYPNARGHAAYHADDDDHHPGKDEELDVAVRGIKKLAGKRIRVYVHGDFVGRMRVSAGGRAHLHRHDGVPAIEQGWPVRVRTKSGKLVTYGKFRAHM